MNKYYFASFALIIIAGIMGLYFYPQMPAIMPSHWNIAGEIDGYTPKSTALFLMPILSVLMLLLFMWFPKADPKQENVAHNQPYYEKVVLLIIAFLFYIYCLTLLASLGYKFDMGKVMVPGLGILFFAIGKQMENIKPNWFFGIRTPWTIHSPEIWEKTHRIGSRLFQALGIVLFCFGMIWPIISFNLLMVFIIALLVWSFAYPYLLWKRTRK